MNPSVEQHFSQIAKAYGRSIFPAVMKNYEKSRLLESLPCSVEGRSLLDVATGGGYYAKLFLSLQANPVWALDISFAMLAEIQNPQIHTVHSEIMNAEFPIRFDCIACMGGLEFVVSPQAAMQRFYDWSERGGYLFLLYPPAGVFSVLYQLYHFSHRIKIHIFRKGFFREKRLVGGWDLIKHVAVHPFAHLAIFQRK